VAWARSNALVLFASGIFSGLLATQVGRMMTTDGWLALVSGRSIVQHGLPWHDGLTVLGHGRRWVDQQWLAQLSLYGLNRLGGVWLVEASQVALVLGAFVGAVVFARRRGATEPFIGAVSLIVCVPLVATASSVRPQSFCYPLWVLLIALTTRSAFRSQHLIAALAVLVLWANLHGSVVLGASLVSARGIAELTHKRRSPLGWVAAVAPWGAVFATPYASGLAHYYGRTAFNPTFGHYLAQWAPTAATPIAIPIFVLVFGGVFIYGRRPSVLNRFEWVVVGLVMLAALTAVRNWPWLCLAAVALAPRGLGATSLRRRSVRDVTAIVGLLLMLALPLSFIGLDSTQSTFYPNVAANRAAAAAEGTPHRTIWASTRLADWLLWRRPDLAGSLVADARYSLLTSNEIERVALFRYGGALRWTLARAQVFVLDPDTDGRALDAIRPDVRVVYTSDHVVIAVARAKPDRG
jgi:hypothetical protein